jgi:hypothetical protein
MIDWQLVAWFAIAIVVILICRRYARNLWQKNLFDRGGPHRAGVITAIGTDLIPVLFFAPVVIIDLFNLRLTSLAFLLGLLACISIPLLVGGYAFGRYLYNVYSPAEVQKLKQIYEVGQSHH